MQEGHSETVLGNAVTATAKKQTWSRSESESPAGFVVSGDHPPGFGRLDLSVPGDLSVAGYDGVPPFDHEILALTTYRIPLNKMLSGPPCCDRFGSRDW